METHGTSGPDATEASKILDDIAADRTDLASRARAPWWFAPGFGLIAAALVGGPAIPDGWGTSMSVFSILAVVVLFYAYRRVTGVTLASFGAASWVLFLAALVISLILLSVSFGLASFDLHWWILATALAAFGVGTLAAFLVTRIARARLTNVH